MSNDKLNACFMKSLLVGSSYTHHFEVDDKEENSISGYYLAQKATCLLVYWYVDHNSEQPMN